MKGFTSSTKFFTIGIIVLVVFIIQRCCCSSYSTILCFTWSSSILFAFTIVLSKILSSIWLFGTTKVYNNLEELSKNPCCAFVLVLLLLSSTWTRTTVLVAYVCDMYFFGFKLFVQRRKRYCICGDCQISFIVVKEFGPIHVFRMIIPSFYPC